MSLPHFCPDPATAPRFLLFTGKGGVGKTSLSCATALKLAEAGKRVLLISTDPASNLDEVLETKLTALPTPIPGVLGLSALNINPIAAAAAYRARLIGPMRGLLPESALRSMEEQLSGSCTVEIAAFDEFSNFIGNSEAVKDFDHLIFDTAPTGHTLRLMGLAKAWDHFLSQNTNGASCLGPLAGLEKQRAVYEATVRTLADPLITQLILVSRPQSAALREAERTAQELRSVGVCNQRLVINGVFESSTPHDSIAQSMVLRSEAALKAFSPFINTMRSCILPLRSINILGLAGLRLLLDSHDATPAESVSRTDTHWVAPAFHSLQHLIAEMEKQGHGVIMTMGKGGVGKTTIAAAIAVLLAQRGHPVHLTTTDPAAHLADALAGEHQGLTLSRIDPAAETATYTREVLAAQESQLDDAGRSLLEEDLRSPCTEEIAVFRAFAREINRGENGFVVLDTAPTGHTLLLLDASEAYHRELERQSGSAQPQSVLRLMERLRDRDFTHILLVTLPEATPVHEAAALQEDLRRARIEPFAWIVNQSLLSSGSSNPLLQRRERLEHQYLREIIEKHSSRTAWLPWQAQEPVGVKALTQLAGSELRRDAALTQNAPTAL